MATSVIPSIYRTHIGLEFIADIANSPENTYYVYLGNHMPEGSLPQVFDDTNDTLISAYRNMIAAKVVTSNSAAMMIRNIEWTSNTVYSMYDDLDTTSSTDDFYAIVNAGAYYHVWKCLDNNLGNVSSVAPDISQIVANDTSYRTSDGYVWKYMSSTSVNDITKFSKTAYFPVFANSQVANSAVPGAIDVIAVVDGGAGYQNYLTGAFAASDLRIAGNSTIYSVTGNTTSSLANGFYTGCNLYISGGSGIGQYRTITDYFANANGNYIVIDTPFNTPPQNGDTYQIYPTVQVMGDGQQTINAAARALINAVGNSVYRVDVLNRGAGYSYITTNVIANAVATPATAAIVRGIYGPFKGHGANVYEELGATRVGISVTFIGADPNVPGTNQYQQVGILKNPQFRDVTLNLTSQSGNFLTGEQVISVSTRILANNANVSASSANVTFTTSQIDQQLVAGDGILLATSDNSAFWYTTINAVTNSTFLTISSTPPWSCTISQVFLTSTLTGEGMVTALPNTNQIMMDGVTGTFDTGSKIIGLSSGIYGVVNNVSRAGTLKNFSTLIAMQKFVATSVSGTFQQNEYVYQGTSVNTATSIASLHSVAANSGVLTMYVSNTIGSFADVSGTIIGSNSGAVATLTTKYNSEIQFGSSKLLYLENIPAVQRSNGSNDTLTLILSF